MRKTLGPLIEVIPPEYQEYLAKIMGEERGSSVHRGMLSFIPIQEMMTAIMTQNTLNFTSTAQGLQQMQSPQLIAQQQHYPMGPWQQNAGLGSSLTSGQPYYGMVNQIKAPLYGAAVYNHLLTMLTSLASVLKMEEVKNLPSNDEDETDPPDEKALSYL